jgi:hypothetical protein
MYIRTKNNLVPITVLSALLLFLLTSPAFALGKVGHQVICQVAFEHIATTTQNKIKTLLRTLPNKHKKLINKYNHRKANTTVSFSDSCTWADAIRKYSSFNQYKKWHYLNVKRDKSKVTSRTCDQNCVTTAIKYHTKILLTPSLKTTLTLNKVTSWEKLQALMFLGHWLGDIHQPMHVNFASDAGGNRIKVAMVNTVNKNKKYMKCSNMHWLWDECLLYRQTKSSNTFQSNKNLFAVLYHNLSEQWKSAPVSDWQKDSIYTWATESLTIARKPSVLYCTVSKNNHCMPLSIATQKSRLKLPDSYQDEHQPILEERMLQASVRLAYTLEQSLK